MFLRKSDFVKLWWNFHFVIANILCTAVRLLILVSLHSCIGRRKLNGFKFSALLSLLNRSTYRDKRVEPDLDLGNCCPLIRLQIHSFKRGQLVWSRVSWLLINPELSFSASIPLSTLLILRKSTSMQSPKRIHPIFQKIKIVQGQNRGLKLKAGGGSDLISEDPTPAAFGDRKDQQWNESEDSRT